MPDRVEAEAVNKWLFNKDTVDKVLEHLMRRGLTVAGADRLGKTILFAKNQDHADFIADRFNVNYPHYKGEFARVMTFKNEYAQTLIDDFSAKHKERIGAPPEYAVADSVDVERDSGLLEKDVRRQAVARLHREVESMNLDNFVVRPRPRLVEKYAKREAWLPRRRRGLVSSCAHSSDWTEARRRRRSEHLSPIRLSAPTRSSSQT